VYQALGYILGRPSTIIIPPFVFAVCYFSSNYVSVQVLQYSYAFVGHKINVHVGRLHNFEMISHVVLNATERSLPTGSGFTLGDAWYTTWLVTRDAGGLNVISVTPDLAESPKTSAASGSMTSR